MTIDMLDFYEFWNPFFSSPKELEDYFVYKKFDIQNFRGLTKVTLSFERNNLVLLLGLNESGKTTILRAIESFDFFNDPPKEYLKKYFSSFRNKQDISCNTPTIITAHINLNKDVKFSLFKKALKSQNIEYSKNGEVENLIREINKNGKVRISRMVPFQDGFPNPSFYVIDTEIRFTDPKIPRVIAQEIVRRCPYIFYFEDFQDLIPEKIYTRPQVESFNRVWYEIIDGLFYNTDPDFSIKKFLKYYSKENRRDDDARTVLKKVNKTLRKTFTEKWKDLSGVRDIEDTELAFQDKGNYFEIKITENDGTTYSVRERSKGAVWYLAFLMKTEFRRKKLREDTGKPIYLIDEPASNLHSTAQENMVQDFYKLVEDTSVIYTTHSRYLVSPSNIKNTYIVMRENSIISCEKWGDYIKGKNIKLSYYQPLADCLDIIPNSLDIPWDKAILTEGPTDAHVLHTMYEILYDNKKDFVIYPGSSANSMDCLISLNIGWGSNFIIVLDSDKEGCAAKDSYKEKHSIKDDIFILLPGKNLKIEGMFTNSEIKGLYELVFDEKPSGKITKKEFANIFSILNVNKEKIRKCKSKKLLSNTTCKKFESIFKKLS